MRALKLGLSPDQIAKRRHSLGGSDANILMNGDPPAINALWEQKTGRGVSDDLSRVLPVQLGSWTEEFNRYWFELMTGRLVYHEGDARSHAELPWMTCTLDGATTTESGEPAIFEAKHVGGFQKIEDVVQKYMPQLHHNMAVCGVSHAVLSVLIGNTGYEPYEVAADWMYTAQLLDREREFWACVTEDRAPHDLPIIAPPALPTTFRTVDMTGNNRWSALAADWLRDREAAKNFTATERAIKGDKKARVAGLLEADVGHAHGHGIEAKRNKKGAVTITALGAIETEEEAA